MARDGLQKPPGFLRVRRVVEQRFDVPAHGGERRAQLVGDVGDEVAPDLIGSVQVGDVVQHQDGAARNRRCDRRRAGDEERVGLAGQRQLEAIARRPAQRRGNLRGDVGVTHDLEVVPSFRRILQLEHPAAGGVDELQPPVIVDDQDPLDHTAEDRFHARAVGVALGRATGDLADGIVQHARDGSNFVGAVVARRLRQIAGGVALGDRRNRAHAPAEERRHDPRHGQGCEQTGAQGDDRGAANGGQLIANLRQR